MGQNLWNVSKANAQLIASCKYNKVTQSATLENYSSYYKKDSTAASNG